MLPRFLLSSRVLLKPALATVGVSVVAASVAIASSSSSPALAAAGPSLSSNDDSGNRWQSVLENYENRIREFSAPEKVFEYFASIKNGLGSDREILMTPEDFVRSITPFFDHANAKPLGYVPKVFKIVDQNEDGLLSFPEYLFFTTLLSIPPTHSTVAFKMCDANHNGTVDQQEFKHFMELMRAKSNVASADRFKHVEEIGHKIPAFFGARGDKNLSLKQFEQFIKDLHDEVRLVQFAQMDSTKSGSISARDFALFLVSFGNKRDMKSFSHKVKELENSPVRISKDDFFAFYRVLDRIDEVSKALMLFRSIDAPFTKQDLEQVTSAVADVKLPPKQLDVLFHLFDKDGDGKLDEKELFSVLRGAQTFGLSKQRDLGVWRFVTCCKDCWTSTSDRSAE